MAGRPPAGTPPSGEPDADELNLRRLRWRSRRGLLELDLVLGPFVERVLPGLPAAERLTYQRLLEEDDPTLQGWFAGGVIPEDADFAALVERIRTVARTPG